MPKKIENLDEKVVTGGGATGQSMTADSTGGKASLPNSKSNSEPMPKLKDTSGTGVEETDDENNVKATGDMSAKNRASIAMKASAASSSMKEEFSSMFEGTEIEADLLDKMATMFEAALAAKITQLEEIYDEIIAEEIEEIETALAEKVDDYLSYVAAEWLEENEVAIESSLKNELAEEFMEDLKRVFIEHYMDIPSDRVDVLESLAARIDELEEKLDEQTNDAIDLAKELSAYHKKEAFNEVSEGLVLTQVEKFRNIAENLEYNGDIDAYKNKLLTVKETYFSEKKVADTNLITEEFEGDEPQEQAPRVSGEMARYVTTISKTLKK